MTFSQSMKVNLKKNIWSVSDAQFSADFFISVSVYLNIFTGRQSFLKKHFEYNLHPSISNKLKKNLNLKHVQKIHRNKKNVPILKIVRYSKQKSKNLYKKNIAENI